MRQTHAKQSATDWARQVLSQSGVIVDFETTNIRNAEIVQVGVIDMQGCVLLDTLVKPSGRISRDATDIHGITMSMVQDAPNFKQVYIQLSALLAGKMTVAYNSAFDEGVLAGECARLRLPTPRPQAWSCAMKAYAQYYGQWSERRRSYKWQSLISACAQQRIQIQGAHSAVGDCLMTLELIRKMAS